MLYYYKINFALVESGYIKAYNPTAFTELVKAGYADCATTIKTTISSLLSVVLRHEPVRLASTVRSSFTLWTVC
jgi:hypothetical protein